MISENACLGIGGVFGAVIFGSAYQVSNRLVNNFADEIYTIFSTHLSHENSPSNFSILKEREFWLLTGTGALFGFFSAGVAYDFVEMFFEP